MKKKILSVISIVLVLLTVMSSFAAMTVFAETIEVDDAPEFKEISATCTSVTIEWEEYEDDDFCFLVYRSATGKAGTWTKLATTKAGATSYTDKTVSPAKTYVYTVKAYYKHSDGTVYISPMSGKHTIKTGLERPVFSLAGNSGNGVLLKWNARSDVSGYILYRSTTGKAGSWSRLGVIKSNKAGSYTDTNVKIGSTYYYCIKAYRTISGKDYYSQSSKAYKIVIKDVAVPENLVATVKEDGIHFAFDKVPATKGYLIYRSETGKAGSWTRVAMTTSNNKTGYVDTKAEEGKVYYYTAKSYKTLGGKNIYSSPAKAVKVTNLLVVPEIEITPATATFKDYYETIPVTINLKNFEDEDKIRIFIDSTEITEELVEDEKAFAEFVEKISFVYELDEKNSKDDKIVLNLIRIAPGEGTLRIEHATYPDIFAEIKVSSPKLSYDTDLENALLNAMAGAEAVENAKVLLEAARDSEEKRDNQVKSALIQLTGAKSSFENAKLLLIKYEADYKKYDDFKAILKAVEDYLDAVNDALKDLEGDTVSVGNIEDAIRELSISAKEDFDK